jgi:signal peptidase II
VAKAKLFWPLALALLLADCSTKRLALSALLPDGSQDVVGSVIRFSLTFNTGAAFGLGVGSGYEPLIPLLALAALAVLLGLYLITRENDREKVVALALICGGAVGNLVDRIIWPHGVVDFIDVGLGDVRWWAFNLADVGIIGGAVLLVWSYRIGQARAAAAGELPG